MVYTAVLLLAANAHYTHTVDDISMYDGIQTQTHTRNRCHMRRKTCIVPAISCCLRGAVLRSTFSPLRSRRLHDCKLGEI